MAYPLKLLRNTKIGNDTELTQALDDQLTEDDNFSDHIAIGFETETYPYVITMCNECF